MVDLKELDKRVIRRVNTFLNEFLTIALLMFAVLVVTYWSKRS